MKNSLKLGALALAGSMVFAACGAAPEAKDKETAAPDTAMASEEGTDKMEGDGQPVADFKACMVSDEGGFDDQSFNQTAAAGLDRAEKELGIKINKLESSSEADFVTNVESLIQDDCTLIVGVGFKLADALTAAAKANPNVHFALVDSGFGEGAEKNGKPLIFNTAEAAFLAGYAAAGTTKTGKVATFGGAPIPSVKIFMDGYVAGVEKYNADKGTAVQVLGWDVAKQDGSFVGNFSDVPAGKTMTEGFLSQGADVIMPVAGPVGHGSLQAVKEANSGAKVIWVDTDGTVSVPESADFIFTSVLKAMDVAVYDTVAAASKGEFKAEPYIGTLANEGVALAPFHKFDSQVSAELKAELEALRADIASGNLIVETKNQPK